MEMIYPKVKEKIKEKTQKGVGEGWRRTSSPKIKRLLYESIHENCLQNERPVKVAIDFFLLIYDTDDAYAQMLHKFVNRCNQGDLELNPEDLCYARGKIDRERKKWWREHDDIPLDFWMLDDERFPDMNTSEWEQIKKERNKSKD